MKKVIQSSNLALRFYVKDGWNKEELMECVDKGSVSIKHPEDVSPYFTLDAGSFFKLEKLNNKCLKLIRAFDDYPNESDIEFMARHQ